MKRLTPVLLRIARMSGLQGVAGRALILTASECR